MTSDSPLPLPLTLCWAGRSLRRRRLPGSGLAGLPAPRAAPERFLRVATPLGARPGSTPPKAWAPGTGWGRGSAWGSEREVPKRPGEGLSPFLLALGEPLADGCPLSARKDPARNSPESEFSGGKGGLWISSSSRS